MSSEQIEWANIVKTARDRSLGPQITGDRPPAEAIAVQSKRSEGPDWTPPFASSESARKTDRSPIQGSADIPINIAAFPHGAGAAIQSDGKDCRPYRTAVK